MRGIWVQLLHGGRGQEQMSSKGPAGLSTPFLSLAFGPVYVPTLPPPSPSPPFTAMEDPPLNSIPILQELCGKGYQSPPYTHSPSVLGNRTPEFFWAHSHPAKNEVSPTAL